MAYDKKPRTYKKGRKKDLVLTILLLRSISDDCSHEIALYHYDIAENDCYLKKKIL